MDANITRTSAVFVLRACGTLVCENLSVWGLNLDVIDSPSCRWSFMFLQEFVQSDIISDSHSEIVQLFHHQQYFRAVQ